MVLNVSNPICSSGPGSSGRRLLQDHLDFILMGPILIAVGLAVPTLPGSIAAVGAVGAVANPARFVPLAFNEGLADTTSYRTASTASFIANTAVALLA